MLPHPNARTIEAIEKMIQQMEYLVDHARIQQRTWVANGRTWLPILRHTIEDLSRLDGESEIITPSPVILAEENAMLIKINEGKGETYININLDDITKVNIDRNGEQGRLHQRGAFNGFELKNGRKYLTDKTEAQRIVEMMRKREEEK